MPFFPLPLPLDSLAAAVEVEIAWANGVAMRSAAVHPKRNASACVVKEGKAFVTRDKPCLVAVDIDGQMDGQDTGKGCNGPPIRDRPRHPPLRAVERANGSFVVLRSVPQLGGRKLVVEDCDVICSRAEWHHRSGGRVFNIRGENNGKARSECFSVPSALKTPGRRSSSSSSA